MKDEKYDDSKSLWEMFKAWKNRKVKPFDYFFTPRGKRKGRLLGHIEIRAGKPKNKDLVAITFDKPIDYIEMTPREAAVLANTLKALNKKVRHHKTVSDIIIAKS